MADFAQPLPDSVAREIRTRLLAWFDRHQRDLPWRRTRDPYAIWISEVMLQQTQVAIVIPFYARFLDRFPRVEDLARAPLPDVFALWRGLGYYARARHLHAAAQWLAREGFPRTARDLRELPGFGRYTAAAVGSIAFGDRAAVLDGNVARVLARLKAVDAPLGSPGLADGLWSQAEALLDPDRPGAFNEAMMELGATVCVPASPRCEACPIAAACEARRSGREHELPTPKVRPARAKLTLACAVVVTRKGLLLARRAERGLFGGLWELPCVLVPGETRSAKLLAEGLGLEVASPRAIATVERTLSHRDLTMRLYRCKPSRRALAGYLEQRFVPLDEIGGLGMSTAMAKAIAAAGIGLHR